MNKEFEEFCAKESGISLSFIKEQRNTNEGYKHAKINTVWKY